MPAAARPRVVAGLRLVAPVGSGAEGEVWEARDARGRRRALKLIRPGALVDPDEVQRRGAWLVHVDHAALARVWRTGVLRGGGLDGWGFVEMGFVEGRSMQAIPAMPDAFERLEPLAEALDLLHAGAWSGGVPLVHRDVKPANLIEMPGGGLVLVDHSTLRAVGADTVTRIGTPVFAAPEVMSGRMGPAADIYSFCATAVALLSGARGETLAGLLADPDGLDVPDGLRAGLRPRPGDRPPGCGAALEGAGAGHPPDRTLALDAPETRAEAGSAPREPAPTESLPAPVLADGDQPTEVVPVADHVATSPLAPVEARPAPVEAPLAPVDAPPDGGTVAYEPGVGPPELGVAPGPRRVSGWLLALAVLALAVPVAALLELPLWPETAVVLAVAALAHLLAHGVDGRHAASALLAPPLAWAFLLAERAAPPGRRRDWGRPLLLGASVVLSGALLLTLRVLAGRVVAGGVLGERLPGDAAARLASLPGETVTAEASLVAVAAALALVAVCVYAVRRGALLLRVLLLPVWAGGALLLLGAGLLLLPFAMAAGRGRRLVRLLGRTVTGAVAFARPERRGAPARAEAQPVPAPPPP